MCDGDTYIVHVTTEAMNKVVVWHICVITTVTLVAHHKVVCLVQKFKLALDMSNLM